ncbi:YbaN family protein [Vallitalea okinawensis]|uniref:YbaN family protein n=1 Tax=Vallitalea okinawensis TaxID=2078660 RepID=UPI001FA8D661|nr:YbaN family protein [Vallitalea okinawensis]
MVFFIVGLVALILGILGVFLPLLPTTPFLLLAAYCLARSSKKMHHWLIHHKILGEYIVNYTQYRAIKKKTKIVAITVLWLSLGISIGTVEPLILKVLLIIIGSVVTFHLLTLKTIDSA